MSQAVTTERLQQLRDIVTDVLELEPDELTETGDFVNDYDADSLLCIDIIARVEREMGVRVPNEALPEMTNLDAVVRIVSHYAGWGDRDA
jgi:acyl carrier protein